ncbi:OLC1v1000626C1 [Oldenlandia corymbosa var. corymbosa]|uniref:OLC1v1000626C1 n=1 Tax=Oldenlandia corymbosa var. corymbosa TaxID=529605 RepID=A0AAV1D4V2_OLDCO|nr:OLC1v1000626C1 [Oldenlandia corymbosa var. corymbosa]
MHPRILHRNITAIISSIRSYHSTVHCRLTAFPRTYLPCSSKPISITSLHNRGLASIPISITSLLNRGLASIPHALKPTEEDNVRNHEEEEDSSDCSYELKRRIEEQGIDFSSCKPGQFHLLICPKCKCGQSTKRTLSFYVDYNKNLSLWRCFADECGWSGQVLLDSQDIRSGGLRKKLSFRPITVQSLNLKPLDDKLIRYFSERRISREILEKNHVMQIAGEKVIAFTYWRNKILVGCKYRNLKKRFWQEKGTEQVFYGLDDIREAYDIIIVEGEVDKLSMEEAGISNCVAVPGGAPEKVSEELPAVEKDKGFQYVWNCKEYFDKASRIILATDADAPGQSLAEELARRMGRERCWKVIWPKRDELSSFKDANEVLMELGPDYLRDLIYKSELHPM